MKLVNMLANSDKMHRNSHKLRANLERRSGDVQKADQTLNKSVKPSREDERGMQLQRVLKYADGLQTVEAPIALTKFIRKEQRKWRPGFGWLTVVSTNPVIAVIGAVVFVFELAFQGIAFRVMRNQAVKHAEWHVPSSVIGTESFKAYPHPVKLVAAMRCYCYAYAQLAKRNCRAVLTEFNNSSKPIQKAVIGWGLARVGEQSIVDDMLRLTGQDDWVVRILAYEAFIVLKQHKIALRALEDRNDAVRMAVAQSMVHSKIEGYIPYILRMADTGNHKQRLGTQVILAMMANNGNPQARAKLQAMAAHDPNHDLRMAAAEKLNAL